ncbi:MAG: hypothetical protein C0393_07670 [Anaerolinea sp.]|nr:hypothetical protein [Anaerolinea sp.]
MHAGIDCSRRAGTSCPGAGTVRQIERILRSKGVDRVQADETGAKYVSGIPVSREPDPGIRSGVTGALAGIAETGTLLIASGEGRPLTASLLPEIHIAVLRAKDLYASLPQVINLREVREASAAVLITGPSRTADIEMTLTIGVHGPKELHVFVVD